MKRTLISPALDTFPAVFHPLLQGAAVYDSSSSPVARVFFIDKEGGYFLKSAPFLAKEAAMTRFYHSRGMAAEVLEYLHAEKDWLLTRAVPGEDCTHYLSDPERLCDTLGELLRALHESDTADCPVPDRTTAYLATARRNYKAGMFDTHLFPKGEGFATPKEAWQVVQAGAHLLKRDTLLHGDFCLPNVILKDWHFSGLIDVDGGGVGDRHIDLFWGVWSLRYNLKTDRYAARFLDAYGRDKIAPEMLCLISAIETFG